MVVIVLVHKVEEFNYEPQYIIWNSKTVQEWESFAIAYGLDESFETIEQLEKRLRKIIKDDEIIILTSDKEFEKEEIKTLISKPLTIVATVQT